MPRPTSIPAGHYAQLLADALPRDHTVASIADAHSMPITLTARRCAVLASGPGWKRRFRLTGGVVLGAELTTPQYGVPWRRELRLKPGWTRDTFTRAAARLYELARRQRELDKRRDLVYAKFGDSLTPAEIAAVEAAAAKDGHSTLYSEMSHADCDYWLAWSKP